MERRNIVCFIYIQIYEAGVVTDTYTYDAFGVTTTSTGVTANPYRYCGEYQDETTGLYYLRARYYDTATGRFTSADSYSGTTSDPVSLHKYLYAHANPVMNSDPTGYFTLFEMSIAMNVQNQLRDTYNSAIIDGFLNFLDTLLGGETDPTALLTSFARGVSAGLVTGALSSGISAMANLSCKLAKASSMLKMGMAGFGFLGSAYSTLQSVEDGNAQQAGFRFILTAVSGIGFKRAMGEGMATINSNCFIAGTLVLTENGNKPIEEIQAGDFVYSTNPETGESEYKEVVQVFENEANELVHLTVNGEEIVTTPKHPFYVPQRGWISAIDLKAGDILVLSNGEYVIVEQVQHEILETTVKVYNFEVQDFHTYYVGENSVLVHNLGCSVEGNASSYYTYEELKAKIKDSGLSGRGVGFEAHHLLEKQFASKFGVKENEIISVALTPRWHRGVSGQKIIGAGINIDNRISNELVNLTGAKNIKLATKMASAEQIWYAHRNVYESIGQYDWANAIYSAYVKPLGINY